MDWFSLMDPIAWMHPIVLQTPTPKVNASPDVELLKSQLEFLKADHARLAADFSERMKQLTAQSTSVGDDFKTYLNYIFGLIAAATGFATWLGWQSLEQAKASIKTTIDRQLSQAVADTIDYKVQMIRRSLDREGVISTVLVDYLLLGSLAEPKECDLLRFRGFQNLKFCNGIDDLRRKSVDIVILDLENWKPNGVSLGSFMPQNQEQQDKGSKPVQDVLATMPKRSIMIVYVRGTLRILNDLQPPGRVIPANSPVTLLGNAAEAAYVTSANIYTS